MSYTVEWNFGNGWHPSGGGPRPRSIEAARTRLVEEITRDLNDGYVRGIASHGLVADVVLVRAGRAEPGQILSLDDKNGIAARWRFREQ